jgi:hypothetical protein
VIMRRVDTGQRRSSAIGSHGLDALDLLGHVVQVLSVCASFHPLSAGMKKPLAVQARGAAAQGMPTRLGKKRNSIHGARVAHRAPGERGVIRQV